IVRFKVIDDHSYLFSSIQFILNPNAYEKSSLLERQKWNAKIRNNIAQEIRNTNILTIKEDIQLWAKDNIAYANRLRQSLFCGDSIELKYISELCSTEVRVVNSIRVHLGQIYVYGKSHEYRRCCYIVSDGLPYNPLYLLSCNGQNETKQTIFDWDARRRVENLVQNYIKKQKVKTTSWCLRHEQHNHHHQQIISKTLHLNINNTQADPSSEAHFMTIACSMARQNGESIIENKRYQELFDNFMKGLYRIKTTHIRLFYKSLCDIVDILLDNIKEDLSGALLLTNYKLFVLLRVTLIDLLNKWNDLDEILTENEQILFLKISMLLHTIIDYTRNTKQMDATKLVLLDTAFLETIKLCIEESGKHLNDSNLFAFDLLIYCLKKFQDKEK
ncbi:unnamed protein product, partial [Didymodactylos carnosus]